MNNRQSVNLKNYKFLIAIASLVLICRPILSCAQSITGISPANGPVGTSVIITGSGFNSTPANNIVFFGGVKAPVISASASTLTITVPTGMNSQAHTVTTNNRTAFASFRFHTTFPGGPDFNSGSFAPNVDISSPGVPFAVAVADLTNDGRSEIITAGLISNTLSVHQNNGGAIVNNFQNRIDFATGNSPSVLAIGDIDGDGLLDLVSSNTGSNTISVLRNTTPVNGIPLFAAKVDYVIPSTAYAIKIGEVNGDGKPDILATTVSNGIVILKNQSGIGTISMVPDISLQNGSGNSGLDITDVNGDNKMDVVTCNRSINTISVFLNTSVSGISSFEPPQNFTAGAGPNSVVIHDMDGDGKNDIITLNPASASVSVLRNIGTGTTFSLAAKKDIALNILSSIITMDIADMNGDGKPDIIFTSQNILNNVLILKNTSNTGILSFDVPVKYTSAINPLGIAAGDLNNDGLPDIATISSEAKLISIRINKISTPPTISSFLPTEGGEGALITINGSNFSGATSVSFGGVAASSFSIISDSKITAMVSTGATGAVIVSTPAGTAALSGFRFLSKPVITSVYPEKGQAGSIVVIKGMNFSADSAKNIVYFGAARATVKIASTDSLAVMVPTGATFKPISVTVDSYTDWSPLPFHLIFPNGSVTASTFVKKYQSLTDNTELPRSVAIGDMDGDGRNDVVEADGGIYQNVVSIFRNTTSSGIISFAPRVDLHTFGNHPINTTVADFDGDGRLDIVATCEWSNNINIFRNLSTQGNISFTAPVFFNTGSYPSHVTVGDIDGDGKIDICVANNSSKAISVFRNNSSLNNISFLSSVTLATHDYTSSVHIGDVDNDGKNDILVTCPAPDSIFSIFRNIGNIGTLTFAQRQDINCGPSPSYITMGDMDGDGVQDIVVSKGYFDAGWSGAVSDKIDVIRNLSTPSNIVLENARQFVSSFSPWSVEIGDADGDGKLDILASDGSNNLSVLRNNGTVSNISFAPRIDYLVGMYSNPVGMSVGDISGDGKPDMVTVTDNTLKLVVFANQNVSQPPALSLILLDTLTGTSCNIIPFYWRTQNESNSDKFYLQKSSNGTSFATVDSVDANLFTSGFITYTLNYTSPNNANNFYRIMLKSKSGAIIYSNTLQRMAGSPAPATITTSGATAFCQGSSVTLTSSSSSANQWYKNGLIISGANNQNYIADNSGIYTVNYTVGGCQSGLSTGVVVTVNQIPLAPVISASSATDFCEGQSVTLTSSAAIGNQWYRDATAIAGANSAVYSASQNGNYAVKTTVNGCTSIASGGITVTIKPIPAMPTITQSGNILTSSASAGNQWYMNDVLIPNANLQTYSATVSGIYSVKVTINGCTSPGSNAINLYITAVNSVALDRDIQIVPNPVHDKLFIHNGGQGQLKLLLYDAVGKLLITAEMNKNYEIDFLNYSAGIYILEAINSRNGTHIQKIIIRK